MRALIFNGQMVELAAADFPVNPAMQWVDAPSGATMDGYCWDGAAVSPKPGPTLAQSQAAQIAILSAACQAQIYAGFQSSALGAAHTYPAKDKDQANLSGSVVASLLPNLPANWTTPFWCEDLSTTPPTWAFVQHTAAQIQQVGSDGKAAIIAALEKNATLAAQVMSITDTTAAGIASIQAIVW